MFWGGKWLAKLIGKELIGCFSKQMHFIIDIIIFILEIIVCCTGVQKDLIIGYLHDFVIEPELTWLQNKFKIM